MSLEPASKKLTVPFHILSITGLTGSGKTSVAAMAPKKMVIMSTDNRYEGVIKKKDEEGNPIYNIDDFLVGHYGVRVDLSVDEMAKDAGSDKEARERALMAADRQAARIRRESWDPVLKDLDEGFKHPEVRTITMDYADELYDIERLSYFGKLERNAQLGYVPVNMEWKQQIAKAHQYRKNLILIQQMAQKYNTELDEVSMKEKSVIAKGEWRKKGSTSADYYVHSFLETIYTPPVRDAKNIVVRAGQRKLKIVQAKLNPSVDGQIIDVPADWVTLMQYLAPDEPAEGWLL